MSNNIQVQHKHYYKSYDSLSRFMSYFCQIDLVRNLQPERVLEVGIGNRTVSTYLSQQGFNVVTFDFDRSLCPECIADIRTLPLKDHSFDVVLACEILEHLPWEDVDRALAELHRVSSRMVIISVPSRVVTFEFLVHLPVIRHILNEKLLAFRFKVPRLARDIEFQGQHYWEMGTKSYPISKIRDSLRRRFLIEDEISVLLNPYHYFFVMHI